MRWMSSRMPSRLGPSHGLLMPSSARERCRRAKCYRCYRCRRRHPPRPLRVMSRAVRSASPTASPTSPPRRNQETTVKDRNLCLRLCNVYSPLTYTMRVDSLDASRSCPMHAATFRALGVRRVTAAVVAVHDMIALTAHRALAWKRLSFSLLLVQGNLRLLLLLPLFFYLCSLVIPCLFVLVEGIVIWILLAGSDVFAALRLRSLWHVPHAGFLAARRHLVLFGRKTKRGADSGGLLACSLETELSQNCQLSARRCSAECSSSFLARRPTWWGTR